jgi:predicted phage tail protein
MVSVSIEGRAGQMLGKDWRLDVGTVGEAVKALRANAGHLFHRALKASAGYILVVDGAPIEGQGCFFKKIKKSLCFIPVLGGGAIIIPAIFEAVFVGLEVYMAATVAEVLAYVIVVAVVALVVYGIYTLITYLNQDGPDTDNGVGTSSFLFSGPENVASQGQVVPVGYGRMKTGSKVISVSSSSVDRVMWDEDELGVFGETVVRRSPLAPSREIGGGSARTRLIKAIPSP